MANETLSFDILARDSASRTFKDVGRAAAEAAGGVKDLSSKLRDVDGRTARARVALDGNKEAQASLDQLGVKLLRLGKQVSNPDISLQGAARARAEISALDLQLDKLGSKNVKPKITVVTDKVAAAGFLQPSALGTAAALLPALIPVAGAAAGAVGLIGASFGAAGLAAGVFGLTVKTVLTGIVANSKKLATAQAAVANATTAATKKTAEANLKNLTSGWSPDYKKIIAEYQVFTTKWQSVSQAIAVPALVPWLDALTHGMNFLKPLVTPVAQEFTAWGQAIDKYFKSKAGSAEMTRIATAVGQFASLQLADIVQFIRDVGSGVHALGHDLSADGVYFGTFGDYLARWGDEFAAWSKSKQARADVQGFLGYMHRNGALVVSVARDLGKVLPGIFKGASATGQLELKAIGGLLSLIAKLPKGWQAPLTEAAGAILLLSKTGVLKVGFTVVGAAAGWVKKLLGGSSVAIDGDAAAAKMVEAFNVGGTAAAEKIAAAMAGGGAAGAGEGAAGGAAGAGASAAKGGTMAALGAASVPVAVGIISGVAIAQLVNNDAASKASQAIASRVMKKNNLTPAAIAAGKQTGGVVPGVPRSSIGSWQTYDHAVSGAGSSLKVWNADAGIGKKVSDALALTVAQMRRRNLDLSATFRNNLIPDLNTMHANTPRVRADVQTLADSILNTGKRSAATRGDRQKLIADLENAGVNAKTATGFVNGLQKKINAMHGKTVKVGVTETGVGHFTIAQVSSLSKAGGKLAGPLGSAAGRLVTGGVPGRDSVLLAAMPGEVVVPTHMVKGGAVDHLRGMIPGFASGGYVGSPAGLLGSFTGAQESAFQARVTSALKSAMTSALRTSIRQAASAFSGPTGGSTGPGAAAAQAWMRAHMGDYGWSAAQFPSLVALWNGESGWRWNAQNPTSPAYGIPQSDPGSKMAAAGADWRTNPVTQMRWGAEYIRETPGYGTPSATYAKWLARSPHWYGNGLDAIFRKPTLIGVGERGPEQVHVGRVGAHATPVVLQVRAPHGATNLERALVEIIQKFVTVNGGDVQSALGRT